VDVRAADRHRLENKQHPAGEIRIGVLVPPDLLAEILERDRLAEDVFNARRAAAENSSDLRDRQSRAVSHGALEYDHEVLIAFAGDLVAAPRPG
jgi:hypothetical protein